MNILQKIRNRFRALTQKGKLDAEMEEEMRVHLELRAKDKIREGMDPEAAHYAASRQFGWKESIKEHCREQRGVNWLENFARDVRIAFRQMLKTPGFTAIAVFTIALGVGVNTSMFSALRAVLVRPLPYPNADRLVQIFRTTPQLQRDPHSVANFLDYQAQNRDFESMAVATDKPFNLAEAGKPAESVRGVQISAGFLPMLGVQPVLGRLFTAEEDRPGHDHVVVLEHGYWLRRFGGDPNIIGQVLRMDGEPVTVVGVMPAQSYDIMLTGPISVWRPLAFTEDQQRNRGGSFLKCYGRLKPGVSFQHAQAEMEMIATRLARDYPDNNSAQGLHLVPLSESALPTQGRAIVWLTMVLAGFVLLIACANLANLQFARTATRLRELAIRGALGAPRGRLLRQLLTESLSLAFIGGVVGIFVAYWCNQLLSKQLVIDNESVLKLPLNLKTLGFAFAASTVSGLVFGLIPAWLASRTDVNGALKQGARGTTGDRAQHRVQHTLIIAEVALALSLLAGAGLVVNGLRGFASLDPGWKVDGLTLGYLTLPESKYPNGNALRTFNERLQETLAALPGVESATLCWTMPVTQFNVAGSFEIEGRPESEKGHSPVRFLNGVTPAYFGTLGMKFLEGRNFASTDTTNRTPVVIINEKMARTFWPNESPIGKRIEGEEIVGVVSNVRFPANPAELKTPFQTYRPLAQEPRTRLVIAVRGNVSGDILRRAVAQLDPDQPVSDAGPASGRVGSSLDNWAVGGRLLTCFALLGLSLAALGIYGVISGFVAQRTAEIGVRMALGARMQNVLWLVLSKGLRLSLFGTVIGLLGAFGLVRILGSVMPALPASDPRVILFVAMLLLSVTFLACWLPARRAARVDPIVALRNE